MIFFVFYNRYTVYNYTVPIFLKRYSKQKKKWFHNLQTKFYMQNNTGNCCVCIHVYPREISADESAEEKNSAASHL